MRMRFRNLKRWPFATILAARNYGYDNVVVPSGAKMGSQLCMAILRHDNCEVKELLERGAPLDYHDSPDGWTPLIYSIYYRNPVARDLLLKLHADPALPDYANRTPLMIAAIVGDKKLLQRLLDMGVSALTADYRSKTAMDFAMEYHNKDCFELLKNHMIKELCHYQEKNHG